MKMKQNKTIRTKYRKISRSIAGIGLFGSLGQRPKLQTPADSRCHGSSSAEFPAVDFPAAPRLIASLQPCKWEMGVGSGGGGGGGLNGDQLQ